MKKVIIFLLVVLFVGFFLNRKEIQPVIEQKINQNILEPKEFTLISTGDIGLVRDINYRIILEDDPRFPFLKIANYLKSADLTITNLEGPLIDNCPVIRDGFTFCGEDRNVEGMVYAGIDAASLANNHITNYGLEGLEETDKVLSENNIIGFGKEGEIKYLEVNGYRVALVGLVELGNNWPGINNATIENVSSLVTEARKNSDIVIVAVHWGEEYVRRPNQSQIGIAHAAIDSGADLVLGNHAHWIQVNEIYKDKFITYAQGNTIFDQDWSQETREGVLYKFVYRDGRFVKIEEKYTIIDENVQPRFATEEEESRIKVNLPQ